MCLSGKSHLLLFHPYNLFFSITIFGQFILLMYIRNNGLILAPHVIRLNVDIQLFEIIWLLLLILFCIVVIYRNSWLNINIWNCLSFAKTIFTNASTTSAPATLSTISLLLVLHSQLILLVSLSPGSGCWTLDTLLNTRWPMCTSRPTIVLEIHRWLGGCLKWWVGRSYRCELTTPIDLSILLYPVLFLLSLDLQVSLNFCANFIDIFNFPLLTLRSETDYTITRFFPCQHFLGVFFHSLFWKCLLVILVGWKDLVDGHAGFFKIDVFGHKLRYALFDAVKRLQKVVIESLFCISIQLFILL